MHAANGMVDLTERPFAFKGFAKEFYSRNQSPIAYEPAAKCQRFLNELLRPALGVDDITLLQNWCGLALLGRNIPQVMLILSGTAMIIVLAFVVRRLPYTLRSSAAILYQISPSIEEASISLGCSPMKTFFKVTAIMMLPGVMAGAILSWITVINDLSASVILYTGGTRTMSVSIYTEVIRASYGTAAALSSILTLTTIVSLMIFFKLTGGKELAL